MMKPRVINDSLLGITLSFGVDSRRDEAHISWSGGTCVVEGSGLTIGNWVLIRVQGEAPPLNVVCRVTALAVGAWLKDEMQQLTERLP